MIPFQPLVLTMLVPVAVVSFALALRELNMPASRWLRTALALYLLPAWVLIDIAFVEWRDYGYQHTCHELSCLYQEPRWDVFKGYSGLAVIEAAALALVGCLALIRFVYLRRVYNW